MKNKKIDFIGIGAMKCGTTWIADQLEDHPEILFSRQKSLKELHYFASDTNQSLKIHGPTNYYRGLGWYISQFPDYIKGKVRGEYCNSYISDKVAAGRIKKFDPNIKIIVSLRNPCDMIYSLYWYLSSSLNSPLLDSFDKSFNKLSWFRTKALYYKQLNYYFKNFPKENIHVIIFDDIVNNPKKVCKDLYSFLELKNTSYIPSTLRQNSRHAITKRSGILSKFLGLLAKSLQKLSPKIYWDITNNKKIYSLYKKINNKKLKYPKQSRKSRQMTYNYYINDIKKLEKLIGRDLSNWKKI